MPTRPSTLRSIASIAAVLFLSACGTRLEDTPEYQAACHGPPLATVEAREQALQDGYLLHRQYDCIDKASYEAVMQQKAEWVAANTPEAKAAREAERKRAIAEEQFLRAHAPPEPEPPAPEPYVIRLVDANTGTEQELASIPGVRPVVARQIVEARADRPFASWDDMIVRVYAFSAARVALEATLSGLTVNGQSLTGFPPNAELATQIKARYDDFERRRACRESREESPQAMTPECPMQ